MENWVERRALCEQQLANAAEVWQSVRTAIDDSCHSYEEHFSNIARLDHRPENGHRILISLHFHSTGWGRQISIEFGKDKKSTPLINVTVDEQATKVFPIMADETHAFISHGGKEVSPDEFTRLALEDALFKPREPERHSFPPRATEWS